MAKKMLALVESTDRVLRQLSLNEWTRVQMSSPQVSTLIDILQALNLGTLIPSAFTLALLWKLYGFFNGLSEKLTRIETKIDGLKDLTPHLVKEQMDKVKTETKPQKHNPSLEKSDWVEVFGIAFGFLNLIIFFAVVIQGWIMTTHAIFWLILFMTGILGVLPIFVGKKTISQNKLALLSLLSLIPWIYLILEGYGIIPQFL